MKANLIIMTAGPGAGKSTFAKEFQKRHNSTNIVSRDEIRFSLLKDGDSYFSREKDVFNKFLTAIKKSLSEYDYTIADATHLNESSRKKLLSQLDTKNIKVISCYLDTPFRVAMERNNKRDGRSVVPETAMKNMFNSITPPKFEEGFDELIVIKE